MLPLPRVSTTQYWKTARAFNTAAEYLELSPADWNLAWRKHTADADFWEWPVPIYYWSKNVFYTGPSVEVRPTIHSFLADFLDPDENYITLVEIGGLGSGKSFSGMVLILYALYLLSCLRNPQEFLRDSPGCSIGRDDPIVVLGTSAAGARQAIKVTFNLVMDKILASPYFERYFAPYAGRASELEFDHNISFSPGTSEWRSVLGWNIFAFTLDEAAFGQDTERADYVAELFKNLEYRRHSRFGPMGFGCLFTSPGSEYGYVESLARDAREWNRNILVRRTTTWEARGELVPVEGWTEMSVKERVGKGVRTFLLASGESPRVLEANLTFLEAGACMRDDGQVLIYGDAGQRLRARLAARGVDLSNISDIADVYPLQDV